MKSKMWDHQKIQDFQTSLLDWYYKNKRNLPWRADTDPYKVWISEIMLQQTRVDTVIDYYYRFMEEFPTIQDLAEA
ncbi:MAG: A/G-specific adenine glycosylase, partial [Tetragenococcus halophilus]|nr:A/G-specific adenine glycosylase [Tetragenococcus halophilus]